MKLHGDAANAKGYVCYDTREGKFSMPYNISHRAQSNFVRSLPKNARLSNCRTRLLNTVFLALCPVFVTLSNIFPCSVFPMFKRQTSPSLH